MAQVTNKLLIRRMKLPEMKLYQDNQHENEVPLDP